MGDISGGAAIFWSDTAKLDFTVTQRSKEFYGQSGHEDLFGSANVSLRFW
ncbi:MAG: hypothetical protein HY053_04710 [Proteobacteria bacterium]|nr:hypothetical protein [Pseudomonadota bacterium]